VYLSNFAEREKDPADTQIPHVLELNRIRLALERSQVLVFWVPEVFIRAVNQSPTLDYAKAYDAVATVRLADGERAEFAIEYERTLKNEQKYAKILETIGSERRLHTIRLPGAIVRDPRQPPLVLRAKPAQHPVR
jgi:hypothetical protein